MNAKVHALARLLTSEMDEVLNSGIKMGNYITEEWAECLFPGMT